MKAWKIVFPLVSILALTLWAPAANAVCPPSDFALVEVQPGVCVLDGAAVPKYEIPLVIPPVMKNKGIANQYDIAVRQFQQQILPGGIWNALGATTANYPPTTVWSYGPKSDPLPNASGLGLPAGVAPAPNSQFNYPAYTVETNSNKPVKVRWINDLKENFGAGPNFLKHLLPVDQTLHWANPGNILCMDGGTHTDCRPVGANDTEKEALQQPYTGPVPIVTHVHGAHVDPHSDGYPEAWWLPALGPNLPAGYASEGTLFDDANGQAKGSNSGYADYLYRQDQPATTLWYHDHSLGMTRSNVYAGPAGFWLIRGGEFDRVFLQLFGRKFPGLLPGPAPQEGDTVLELNAPGVLKAKDVRSGIREIPIVIQDRAFKPNGDLFYPDNRDFFELNQDGDPLAKGDLADSGVVFSPVSEVAPIWNPEAFFNMMVVNGVAWPKLEVAPALYRFRFLNGCNSRFLWLKFSDPRVEVYQIGAEQGFLPAPVLMNGLDLDQSHDGKAQLLMALAERADVIVDFRFLPNGTEVELLNLGPDEPFGGGIPGSDFAASDSATTGKVMKFVVNRKLLRIRDLLTTPPKFLALNKEPALGLLTNPTPRRLSLNEEESASQFVCFLGDGIAVGIDNEQDCTDEEGDWALFGPTAAKLGTVGDDGIPVILNWSDDVTEHPAFNSVEQWDIYNFTVDAHPIHLHLVRFEVVNREGLETDAEGGAVQPAALLGNARSPEPWENGYKDTVIAYPGEVTRVKARFDIEGLYVWHCHIVEHEDNEMMRPYCVGDPSECPLTIAGSP